MFIASVDKAATSKLQKHLKQKSDEQLRTLKYKQKSSADASLSQYSSDTSKDVTCTECDDKLHSSDEYFATCSATTNSQM